MKIDLHDRPLLETLDDGLVLCRSCSADAEALGEFNSRIHSDDGFDVPDLPVAAWTRDLLARPHPTFHPDDFTIVAEAVTGRIVSAMCLISQTWAYAGIPFGVGRPELVGTLPEYRSRGLVRRQFAVAHAWSAARGEPVQAITGIPYYYRLFGYEMCVELGGVRLGYEPHVPKLKEGETEPFTFRPAVESDLPFLMQVYDHACQRKLLTCVRDEAVWQYTLFNQDAHNVERLEYRIICRTGSLEPVGILAHPWYNGDTGLAARLFELKPGVSFLDVTPSVIRYLWATGVGYRKSTGGEVQRTSFGFRFGTEHPVYELFPSHLPAARPPYAFFMRLADPLAFLRLITPELERRIAASPLSGASAECTVGFYRSGMRLVLQQGRLSTLEPWQPQAHEFGDAAFPPHTFLQLLFGYRSLDELRRAFADCYPGSDVSNALLNALFPKQASDVLYVD